MAVRIKLHSQEGCLCPSQGESIPQREKDISEVGTRAVRQVSKSRIPSLLRGVFWKSRLFKPFAAAGIAALILYLISNPAGWLTAAVIGTAFLVTFIACGVFGKGFQKMKFEISAVKRLIKDLRGEKDYGVICTFDNRAKLILSSLPNQMGRFGEELVRKHRVGAILSVNESWERRPMGLSVPYTKEDWLKIGVGEYFEFTVRDHTLLSIDQLNEAADWIHEQIEAGISVAVHCRAGVGRSAMAVAAYLIKYQHESFLHGEERVIRPKELVDRVAHFILVGRPSATIRNKLESITKKGVTQSGLYCFADHLREIRADTEPQVD